MADRIHFDYKPLQDMMVRGVHYGRRSIPKAANRIALQIASDINLLARRHLQGRTKALPNTFPVPRRSFDLYKSQRIEKIADGVYRVFNDSRHAAPVHNGHKSYTVTAKEGKFLAWVKKGPRPTTKEGWAQARKEKRAVFALSVRVPAMRRRPFLKLAVFKVMKDAATSTVAHAIALKAYEGFR